MRKDKLSKQNVILYFLGIIPVVWLGLLIAPCLEDGLIGLVQQFGTIMQNPFRIELCEDSVKAVLVLLLAYGIAIGVYLSSEHNYRRREEHGSMAQPNGARLAQSTRNMPTRIRQRTRFSRKMSQSGLTVESTEET